MEVIDKEAEALAALEKAEAAASPLQTSLSMLRRGEGGDDKTPIMVAKSLMYKAAPYKFVEPRQAPNRRRARKVPPPSTEGVAAQTTAMMLGTKTYAAELSKARSEGRFLL